MSYREKDDLKNQHGPVEKSVTSQKDFEIRDEIDELFTNAEGTNYTKLYNFPRYAPRQAISKFLCRYEIFKKVLNVQGSIIECGVLYGGSLFAFAHASAILEPLNFQRKIIGFDTFEGFSSIHEKDKTGTSDNLVVGGYSGPSYENIIESAKVHDKNRSLPHISKIELVKGDLLETLPEYIEKHPHLVVSLLHLDIDLYEPTLIALKLLRPRMPKGSVIVFDELNCSSFPGETIALIEEFGINNLKIKRISFETMISYAIL